MSSYRRHDKPVLAIVTTTELKGGISEYVGIKQNNYHIVVGLTEEIYGRYPNLSNVDAIKAYLMSEHKKRRLKYALIVGNTAKIPTPTFYDNDIEKHVAYENYYCCNENSVVPLFPVSRIPAWDESSAKNQLGFALNYRARQGIQNVCLVTDACTAGKDEYKQNSESVAEIISGKFNVTKRYDGESRKSRLIETINNGVDFLTFRGHGYCFMWGGSIGLARSDVRNLNSGTPIIFSIACNTAAIHDEECFAETWMKNLKSVAFLGASAPVYRNINSEFNNHIWEAICNHGMTKIGDIFHHAVLSLHKNASKADWAEHNIKSYVLLGDPTLDYISGGKS